VPQFSTITHYIKLLWNDPVWSKVIATGIVSLIALIGVAIFGGNYKTKWPIVGMMIFGVGFVGCAVWYWSALKDIVPLGNAGIVHLEPSLGSLRFVLATMRVNIPADNPTRANAQMEVTLHNDNDFLVAYSARMTGNINGKSSGSL
jgi:hypothetical protein